MKSSAQSSPFLVTPALATLISLFVSGCPSSSSPSPHLDAGTSDAPVGAGGITGAGGTVKADAMVGAGAGGTSAGGMGGATGAGGAAGRGGAIGSGGATSNCATVPDFTNRTWLICNALVTNGRIWTGTLAITSATATCEGATLAGSFHWVSSNMGSLEGETLCRGSYISATQRITLDEYQVVSGSVGTGTDVMTYDPATGDLVTGSWTCGDGCPTGMWSTATPVAPNAGMSCPGGPYDSGTAPDSATRSDAGSSTDGTVDAGSPTVTPVPLFYQAGPDFSYDPTAIADDDAYVYWTTSRPGYVMKVAKTGGTPVVVYNAGDVYLDAIAVDATSVYFEQSFGIAHSFLKVPKDANVDAGNAQLLAQTSSASGLSDIAIDAKSLYYYNGGGIYSVPLDGGTVTTVVDTTGASPVDPILGLAIGFPGVWGMISDGTTLYYTVGQSYGGAVASDSPLAYTGWLLSVPVVGGVPSILAPKKVIDANGDTYVDDDWVYPWVRDGFVYWRDHFSGNVYSESTQGGTPNLLASGPMNGGGTAVSDGVNVYYITSAGLMKVPVAGGNPVEVVHDGGNYLFNTNRRPLLVDDTSVYVIAYAGHGILKVSK
jgi:hypothetical protein